MSKPSLAYTAICILTLVLILYIALCLYLFYRRQYILLMGISGSGKTTLFLQLLLPHNIHINIQNVSSNRNVINAAEWEKNAGYNLVDVPMGTNPNVLPNSNWSRIQGRAVAIIFLIDSGNIQSNCRDVAQSLFQVLTDPLLAGVPLLIVCNKQDAPNAKSHLFIQGVLERELNELNRPDSTQTTSANQQSIPLCADGVQFRFRNYKVMKVSFAETVCATFNSDENDTTNSLQVNIQEVRQWLTNELS